MIEQLEIAVRETAVRKGLALVRIPSPGPAGSPPATYQLVVPDMGVRVYPQGVGAQGAPLAEVEDWLSCPWE